MSFSMMHTFEGKDYLLNLIDTPVGRHYPYPNTCIQDLCSGSCGLCLGGIKIFGGLPGCHFTCVYHCLSVISHLT